MMIMTTSNEGSLSEDPDSLWPGLENGFEKNLSYFIIICEFCYNLYKKM